MKKVITMLVMFAFAGSVFAQDAFQQNTQPAKTGTDKSKGDKAHHHHHHDHKPGDRK